MASIQDQQINDKKSGDLYSTLDPEHPHIRLVTLKPGIWSDEINCSINIVPFDGSQTYEALSYVWGDRQNKKSIRLDDHNIEVTDNLWLAMRRLRKPSTPRVVWIDAICINQDDNDEKSHQVGMMGDIYRGCTNCVIWLGESAEKADPDVQSVSAVRAIELLGLLASDRHLPDLPCFSTVRGQRTDITKKYEDHFAALGQLLDLPWWRRIWVIQELVLPRAVGMLNTHAATCCKSHRMTLRALGFDPLLVIQEQVDPIVSTREKWAKHESTTLSQLRRQFYAFQATEKRDLFYGLLGLVTDWGSTEPLQPNYGSPPRVAITEAVFKCISEQAGMEFLLGERMFRISDPKNTPDLPSWVPDAYFCSLPSQWVMVEQRRLVMSSSFSAPGPHGQNPSELALGRDETLFAQSLKVDKVAKVGTVCEALEKWSETPGVFRQWLEMVGLSAKDWPEQPPEEGTLRDVFWRTILNNSVEVDEPGLSYREPGAGDYSELRKLWFWFRMIGPFLSLASHDMLQSMASKTVYHIVVCLWQRRLIITESGMIGLGPRDTDVGDEVHVMLGSPSPFILRPIEKLTKVEDRPDPLPTYTVIGNGYVHDIMFGKAVNDETLGDARTIAIY
ncbi:heterokaryon incompatibility protein-domain-containing protein [Annulohypoxylon bovei var. microspora]|nr:heterokaryon incompatibility protein-domain-containing protein [Annulohypoxylon bovei var. microspora]